MEQLTLQLRRKQLLQQQLALPVIHEKIRPRIPQTSVKQRKQPTNQPSASETALSPEEQHLQDQIRYLFLSKRRAASTNREHIKSMPTDYSYAKQKKNVQLPRISISHQKTRSSSPEGLRKIDKPKASLDAILLNKNEFVQQYFMQMKQRNKKINLC